MLNFEKKFLFGSKLLKKTYVLDKLKKILSKIGYENIEFPCLIPKEIFLDVGELSEIVHKQMFEFGDLVLRPEGTMPIVSLVAKTMKQQSNIKFFYHQRMFRHEREQKLRKREFEQLGVEIFNTPIITHIESFKALQFIADKIQNLVLKINYVGNSQTIKNYSDAIVKTVKERKLELSDFANNRLDTNALKILDSKHPKDIEAVKHLPKILSFLSNEEINEYEKYQSLLKKHFSFKIVKDELMVRGLDYYQGLVFEMAIEGEPALVGGGQYYCKQLDFCGFGYAIGIERCCNFIDYSFEQKVGIAILINEDCLNIFLNLSDRLNENIKIKSLIKGSLKTKISKCRKMLDSDQADFFIIIGDEEAKSGNILFAEKQSNARLMKIEQFLRIYEN